MGRQVALAPFLLKPTSKTTPPMSADPNTPLFEISDGDNITYEDDPAIIQVRENLVVAECIQPEKAEQRRLEREEWRVRVEVERLKGQIEEVERAWRELEETELRRLAQEKDRLEEEKWVEEQCGAQLCGAEEGGIGGTIASQSWPE